MSPEKAAPSVLAGDISRPGMPLSSGLGTGGTFDTPAPRQLWCRETVDASVNVLVSGLPWLEAVTGVEAVTGLFELSEKMIHGESRKSPIQDAVESCCSIRFKAARHSSSNFRVSSEY